jgi:hypothetical protein
VAGLDSLLAVALALFRGAHGDAPAQRSAVGCSSGSFVAFWSSEAGALTIVVFGWALEYSLAAEAGVGLSLLGALAGVFGAPHGRTPKRVTRRRIGDETRENLGFLPLAIEPRASAR